MSKKIILPTKKLKNVEIRKLTPYLNDMVLTHKQRAFIWYYVHNGNDKYEAVVNAGYSTSYKGSKKRTVMLTQAHQLLYLPKIQEAIKRVIDHEIKISVDMLEYNIFKILMTIVNMDILDYLNEDGTVKKKLTDIPKQIRKLIKKTEVKYYGREAEVKVLTLEFLGKEWAMEKLMKYINMIKDDPTTINFISEEMRVNLLNILSGGRVEK